MAGPGYVDPNLMSQVLNQINSQGLRGTTVGKGNVPRGRNDAKDEGKTPPPPTGGRGQSDDTFQTSVTPLIGGETIFPTAREMIKNAKDSVALEIYQFGNPQLEGRDKVAGVTEDQHFKDHQALVQELVDAAKRGVKVQVLMDSSKTKSGEIQNKVVGEYLQANGVEVLRYPKSKANIDHVKLLVVDDHKAMIGGMNWGSHSPVNHDANVLIQGREAAELKKEIFDKDTRFSGNTPADTRLNPDRENKIDVLTTAPVEEEGGSDSIKKAILDNINSAKKSVYAELFCLTHQDVVQSLKDAHNRGVDVKVLLDPNLYIINRKAFYDLKKSGVPIRWYTPDVQKEEKLHAKWASIDGEKTIIGSANWSATGLEAGKPGQRTNHEANVLIRDEQVSNIFQQQFMKDWETRSSEKVPPHMRFS